MACFLIRNNFLLHEMSEILFIVSEKFTYIFCLRELRSNFKI